MTHHAFTGIVSLAGGLFFIADLYQMVVRRLKNLSLLQDFSRKMYSFPGISYASKYVRRFKNYTSAESYTITFDHNGEHSLTNLRWIGSV